MIWPENGTWWAVAAVAASPVLLVGVAVLIQIGTQLMYRWQYRKLPGPTPSLIFGNLGQIIAAGGSQKAIPQWKAQHGDVFQMYFGGRPFVVVTTPELARSALYKFVNHGKFTGPAFILAKGDYREMDVQGLLQLEDQQWRVVRNAWQPVFAPGSLTRYSQLMSDCADKLGDVLALFASSGQPVDVHDYLSKMTLAVVGTCAYGIDFRTLEQPGSAHTDDDKSSWTGARLVAASKTFFQSANIGTASAWALPALLMPVFQPAIRDLANLLPDKKLSVMLEARQVILNASEQLISRWRAAAAAATAGSEANGHGAVNGKQAAEAGNGHGGDVAAGSGRGAGPLSGVAAGSFLDVLLADKNSAMSDLMIMAQASTFILAGTETTANTLSFTLYLLSQNPDAEARLLAEIDAFGRSRPVSAADPFPWADAVVQESLRVYPPAHATTRKMAKGVTTLGNYTLPPNAELLISIYAIHHDPAYWPRPEEFLPQRFLPEHEKELGPRNPNCWLPFGAGTRQCIGYKFALQEARIALVRLYQRYTFKYAQEGPLQTLTGITIAPKNGLLMTVHAR